MITEQKINILEWFLKDHVTLKTEVMNDAENLALYHRNNVLQYNHIEKNYFQL